ncbi:hypothetical protein EHW67_11205 [Arenibacter aquaticus]|uniref:Uncharacterized protein n=1 Tax=Arenibacter aquaticus TaxID=2489054 RepID=A0A3S0C767_9FLAO|nr:hypothetical protein [Arenibacter aquaticus]RTE53567.1 hypothetical protein EHW67_11205 [Arenibacter aquaticus]
MLFLTSVLIYSCNKTEKVNLSFDGELLAKNVISLQGEIPEPSEKPEYSWYISTTKDGEWKELHGIWTNKIVLLTSYADHFLKCEISYKPPKGDLLKTVSVISSEPIVFNENTNTDWFQEAGFGVMVHYLKNAMVPDGGTEEWNKVVNSFNVENFASQVHEAGAGYVMFTLGQNSGYYCSPNTTFDKAVGVEPGNYVQKGICQRL